LSDDTPTPPPGDRDVTIVTIEEELKSSYLDYAMSVIVSRALPDVRDGLKPVHRRILYGMAEAGSDWSKPYRKAARIVGDVMGKYHPHGDAAIYDAMVRMAQDFSMRLPLVDGQGNFGSMDGDPPAAMRYTEARLAKSAQGLLNDIDKDTVDFRPNYDESLKEPVVLPAEFPNLLVNGAGGIAVGMATNIPPHNLGEVIDACVAYIDDPAITIEELIAIVPGPDFPTGGQIVGTGGIRAALTNGRGSVVMRAKSHTEAAPNNRTALIVTEIPYQVNKARMIERIAEVGSLKLVEGIAELRDESDRHGLRVVMELKRDAEPEIVLNQLYRHTPLQTSFGVNMLALNGGRPELMSLKDIIVAFVAFREEVIRRRTTFELNKARDRAHVLLGLALAVANLDAIIALIRAARDPAEARAGLMDTPWPAGDVAPLIALVDEPGRAVAADGTYRMSEEQARAILELRLNRLTGLEREKIAAELNEVVERITEFLTILASRDKLYDLLRSELLAVKERFADPRRTEIIPGESDYDIEDLIQREEMVVTLTHGGYIKRVPLSAYRAQRRGGKGRAAMATREDDVVTGVWVVDTHTPVLFFSSRGIVYKLKVWRLPQGSPQARGKALVNLLPLEAGETVTTLMPLPDEAAADTLDVIFATASGGVRRNRLSDFVSVNVNGKIAMKLDEGDRLVGVHPCGEDDDVLLATARGRAIRFAVGDVRVFKGRDSTGVRGIRLGKGDEVISATVLRHAEFSVAERDAYLRRRRAERADFGAADANGAEEAVVPPEAEDEGEIAAEAIELDDARFAEMAALDQLLLTVTARGFGKRSSAFEYPVRGRGGQGVRAIELGDASDNGVVASFPVAEGAGIVMMTDGGQLIRTNVDEIRIAGRATRGVRLIRVDEGERVVTVSAVPGDDEEGETAEDGETAAPAGTGEGAGEDAGDPGTDGGEA